MPRELTIILILILLILGLTFFGWPKYQEVTLLKLKIKEKKLELQTKDQYFSEINQLSLKLKEYPSELMKIETVLPANPQIPDLLNFVQKESAKNGLILKSLKLEGALPLEKGSKIQKSSLILSLGGSYPALKNFLSSLEKSARLIEVESISFSQPEKGEVFSFELKIKTYSY